MRLLLIANDFPNPIEPTKAVFNLHLARGLAQKHEVRVVAPVSWFDEMQASAEGKRNLRAHRQTSIESIPVYYPRYVYPPKVLRTKYGWFYWRSIRGTIRKLMAQSPPEAIVSYWVHPDGEGAMRAARHAKVPCAVIVGGSDVQLITKDPARRKCVVDVLAGTDAIVTVNQDLKEKVQAFGIPAAKVHVWSQGIDERVFYPGNRIEARKKLGIREEGAALLWVGRMVQVKGLEILIDAAAKVKKSGRDFRLYLVGDGPLRGSLEEQCKSLGIVDSVVFAGSRLPDQLGNWYRAADLFVMSSWSEGLPNVLRETLACGTPFVSSRVGGIAEIAGEENRLFPAGDSGAMAEAIEASLAEQNGHEPSGVARPATWGESAEKLVGILRG